jgi:hypothetical protein
MQHLRDVLLAHELPFLKVRTQRKIKEEFKMYTDANNKGNYTSNRRGSLVKRVLASLILAGGLLVAGVQSTPTTTQASAPCEMSCTEIIDPNTGQCAIQCCPVNPDCKQPCEMKPCATPALSQK